MSLNGPSIILWVKFPNYLCQHIQLSDYGKMGKYLNMLKNSLIIHEENLKENKIFSQCLYM